MASSNGTFHDRSVVAEASRPGRFVIETDARLDRKRRKPWEVHFTHRYDIQPDGAGSRIVYTETVQRLNYVPYWLRLWLRPLSRMMINRADARQPGESRPARGGTLRTSGVKETIRPR